MDNQDEGDQSLGNLGTEAGDEDEELFGAFHFRSFKAQKLIEEDYEMVNIKEPERPQNIRVADHFPEEKIVRDAVEVVPVEATSLADEEKKKKAGRKAQLKAEHQLIVEETGFVKKTDHKTQRELSRR